MGDSIHKTHFQVPEMPWRKRERQAVLLFKDLLLWIRDQGAWGENEFSWFVDDNKDLVDWVMKYKGE